MKKYSFKRGYKKLTLDQEKECRELLMRKLHITTRKAFRDRLEGKVEPKISEYKDIEAVFQRYEIADIWGGK